MSRSHRTHLAPNDYAERRRTRLKAGIREQTKAQDSKAARAAARAVLRDMRRER